MYTHSQMCVLKIPLLASRSGTVSQARVLLQSEIPSENSHGLSHQTSSSPVLCVRGLSIRHSFVSRSLLQALRGDDNTSLRLIAWWPKHRLPTSMPPPETKTPTSTREQRETPYALDIPATPAPTRTGKWKPDGLYPGSSRLVRPDASLPFAVRDTHIQFRETTAAPVPLAGRLFMACASDA